MVIRYAGLAGTMTYRSFGAVATWTFSEGERTLRRVGTRSGWKGSSLGAGQGKNAFHRGWSMMWRSRRPAGVKRKRRYGPRGAVVTGATVISRSPARGRAFARPLADCGLIADLPGTQEPSNQPQFPRALSHKPLYPPIGPLFPLQRAVFCEPARARARASVWVFAPR